MVVSIGPVTCEDDAPVKAAIEVRQPVPALHIPVLGFGQIDLS